MFAGLAAHNLHSDTPQRHSGPLAAHLVDLATLLYTVGLQITYQRLSAQVRNIRDMHAGITRLNANIAEDDRRADAAAAAAEAIASVRSRPATDSSGSYAAATADASGDEAAAEAESDAAAAAPAPAAAQERDSTLRETRAKAVADIEAEIRLLEWHQRAAVHGGWKSAAVLQISLYLAHVLRQIQERSPNVWSHVPEMYVEFAVCAHHALQRHTKRPLQPATRHVALLLSRLLGDPRVVTPTMRDVVLQSVTNLLASSAPLSALADDDEVMGHLLPGAPLPHTAVTACKLAMAVLQVCGCCAVAVTRRPLVVRATTRVRARDWVRNVNAGPDVHGLSAVCGTLAVIFAV